MKKNFKILWILSVVCAVIFAIMNLNESMWISIGVMWLAYFGIIFSNDKKINNN